MVKTRSTSSVSGAGDCGATNSNRRLMVKSQSTNTGYLNPEPNHWPASNLRTVGSQTNESDYLSPLAESSSGTVSVEELRRDLVGIGSSQTRRDLGQIGNRKKRRSISDNDLTQTSPKASSKRLKLSEHEDNKHDINDQQPGTSGQTSPTNDHHNQHPSCDINTAETVCLSRLESVRPLRGVLHTRHHQLSKRKSVQKAKFSNNRSSTNEEEDEPNISKRCRRFLRDPDQPSTSSALDFEEGQDIEEEDTLLLMQDDEEEEEEEGYDDENPPGDRVAYIHVGEGGEADLEAQLKGAENLDIQILEEENLPDIDETDMIHGLDHTGTARDYVDERHRCTVNCPVGCQGHLRPNEIVIYESFKWKGKLRGRRR